MLLGTTCLHLKSHNINNNPTISFIRGCDGVKHSLYRGFLHHLWDAYRYVSLGLNWINFDSKILRQADTSSKKVRTFIGNQLFIKLEGVYVAVTKK